MTAVGPFESHADTLIVTSLSGAGRTEALRVFEDLGFYCVSNILPDLLTTLPGHYASVAERLALCPAVLPGQNLHAELLAARVALRSQGRRVSLVFLDCAEQVLLGRYALSRRPHPWFAHHGSLLAAIRAERAALEAVRDLADEVIDTSALSVAELRTRLVALVQQAPPEVPVTVMSFGFKRGIPADAQCVFDVRFLPNPYYESELRPLTGLDAPVADYIFASEQAQQTYRQLADCLRYLIAQYRRDRRSQVLVGIGCTGGQHRSVAFVERLVRELAADGFACRPVHRDMAANQLELRR